MSWDGWMAVTSDSPIACQPPGPDTAQSGTRLKVPLSQTGFYGCHALMVKASSSQAMIHRELLALVKQNAGAQHSTVHFLNSGFFFVRSAKGSGQCQMRQRGFRGSLKKKKFLPFTQRGFKCLFSFKTEMEIRYYVLWACVSVAILRAAFSECHSQEIWFLKYNNEIRLQALTFGTHTYNDKMYVAPTACFLRRIVLKNTFLITVISVIK